MNHFLTRNWLTVLVGLILGMNFLPQITPDPTLKASLTYLLGLLALALIVSRIVSNRAAILSEWRRQKSKKESNETKTPD